MREENVNASLQDRPAGHRQQLLRNGTAKPSAAASGSDDGGHKHQL
jgi:hypothetical protein